MTIQNDQHLGTDPIKVSEPVGERNKRHARRAGLYVRAGVAVAAVIVLVALIAANTDSVTLHWVVGTTKAPLVWIIVVSALVGWIGGLVTAGIFHRRTRGPK
jgi:uncharacterized integral membrane protein